MPPVPPPPPGSYAYETYIEALIQLQLIVLPALLGDTSKKGFDGEDLNVFMSFLLCWETAARKCLMVRTLNVFMSFLLCWETPARKGLMVRILPQQK